MYDFSTGNSSVSPPLDDRIKNAYPSPDNHSIIVRTENECYLFNRDIQQIKKLQHASLPDLLWNSSISCWDQDGELFLIQDEVGICLFHGNGDFIRRIDINSPLLYAHFIDAQYVAVILEPNIYVVYDLQSGATISQVRLHYVIPDFAKISSKKLLDGKIIVFMGSVANILDADEFVVTAYIRDCNGYMPGNDSFYTTRKDENGSFFTLYIHHFSLDELIELAKNQIGSLRQ